MQNLEDYEILQYFQKFRKQVKVGERTTGTLGLKKYNNCFTGKEAITTLCTLFTLKREQAQKLGQLFMDKGFFVHVTHKTKEFKDKSSSLYCFTNHKRASRHSLRLSTRQSANLTESLIILPSTSAVNSTEEKKEKKVSALVALCKKITTPSAHKRAQTSHPAVTSPKLQQPPQPEPRSPTATCSSSSSSSSSSSAPSGSPQLRPKSPRLTLKAISPRRTSVAPKTPTASAHNSIAYRKGSVCEDARVSVVSTAIKIPRRSSKDNDFVGTFTSTSPLAESILSSSGTTTFGSSLKSPRGEHFLSTLVAKTKKERAAVLVVESEPMDELEAACRHFLILKSKSEVVYGTCEYINADLSWPEVKQQLLGYLGNVTIDEVLADTDMKRLLQYFAKEEYAEENLLFYDEVMQFKQIPSSAVNTEERLKKAHHIYKTFIMENGEYSLNINQKTINESTKMFLTTDTPKMFDSTLGEVKQAIADLFDRFKLSLQH